MKIASIVTTFIEPNSWLLTILFLVELGCTDLLCKYVCLSVGLTYTLLRSLLSTLKTVVSRKLISVLDISYSNLMTRMT